MRNRIKDLLKQRGWTNDELAERLGAHTTTVSRLINQKILLGEDWLVRLGKAFGVEPHEILVEPPSVRMVPVIGHVQAGLWEEVWEWTQDDRYSVPIPDDGAYRHLTLHAAETRGPSMNRRYPEGTVIVFTDHIQCQEDLVPGRRYIVERERADGLREATVKRLWQDDDGRLWLLPESDDPRFQEPIAINGAEGDTIRILGRVVYAVQREP